MTIETVSSSMYSYDVTGLVNGTTYYFAVKAASEGGDSIYSNEVSATLQVASPGAPVLQSAVVGDRHVNLAWNAVKGSTGYNVYSSTTSGSYTAPTGVTGTGENEMVALNWNGVVGQPDIRSINQ